MASHKRFDCGIGLSMKREWMETYNIHTEGIWQLKSSWSHRQFFLPVPTTVNWQVLACADKKLKSKCSSLQDPH